MRAGHAHWWLAGPLVAALAGAARADSHPLEVLSCLLEPYAVIELSAQEPGIVEEVRVRRGDRVEKGQPLVKLVAGVERAAVGLARARHDFARRKLARNQSLIDKELISAHERDEMETEADIARLELAQARARLAMRTINATASGIVTRREVEPGSYVGEQAVLEVVTLDPLQVEVIAPVGELGRVKPGMEATIEAEALPGKHRAVVKVVDAMVDPTSDTFGIRLELANPDGRLPAGLKCNAVFRLP